MSFFDIIVAALLGYSLYKGIKNGLFVEVASFISLLLGIYLAIKFSSLMSEMISKHVSWNPTNIQITAFILTFILVVIGVYFLAKILTGIADFAMLGWMNKLGGGFFRVLKTILILSIFIALFEKINFNNTFAKKETLDNTIFYNPVKKVAAFVYPSIEKWYDTFKKEHSEKAEEKEQATNKE
ncbi:CvpA family protein [Flavobacterium johnsoniae]|jgi:membrane protein required for colicin V production|uniref:Colicin V production protein n=1 Tax=Flavobacterium johnsoniae (strain ATCC 17061 / DSM 2064 / JCM 8514 / BCRC 14874 / CCUG 350202 / NBRC 14942 / NCIMB 11054 / UW101) TaxID=376686 RepID=A5FLW4_FLAJ1|nr:CvpA family protein [Flavobacterium johnsoniae]ABQ03805.1 Colicin V production protein [Flavobacterium johnsoniae UW101]OXG03327.1 colicin V production protein [Flavobacterium johnsoniae UW101]WQG79331.1 CvpA family protein [Flavobacterium johnsoniae UW101]SHK03294.1 membrane protein required for colicin V production [Flavobacterium johnsoniae]